MSETKNQKNKPLDVKDSESQKTAKYKVQGSDLHHNGKKYQEGSIVELTKKEASALKNILAKQKK